MRGQTIETDNRGVSEIYGTVLIISLAFVTALLVIGLGAFVVDELQSDTDDTISQDAMAVMNDRMADVSASSVNASQEFMFQEGAGDVEASPDEGEVFITTHATRGVEFIQSDTPKKTEHLTLGSITHEAADGTLTVSQGGGLWEREQGVTSVNQPPQFNYDGDMLSLGFTNLTDADLIQPGQAMTVRNNPESSVATSEAIFAKMSELWTVETNEFGVIGTDTVHVNVTIRSEFAGGWAEYGEEMMEATPAAVIYEPSDDPNLVTFYFEDVGTPLDANLFSDAEDIGDDKTIYAGNSSLAPFNSALEPTEDGFTVNHTEAQENDEIDEAANDDWYIAIYDKTAEHFVLTEDGEDWWLPDDDEEDLVRANPNPNNDHEERVERIEDQIGEDAIQELDESTDYEAGEYEYSFDENQAICIVSDEEEPHSANFGGNPQQGSYEYIENEVCDELIGMADDPRDIIEGPEFLIDDSDVSGADPVELGETVDADATIKNDGDQAADDSVLLKVEDGSQDGPEVDGTPVGGMVVAETKLSDHSGPDEPQELGVGEDRHIEMEWSPRQNELEDVYEGLDESDITEVEEGVYELEPEIKVVTGNDVVAHSSVTLEYDAPDDTEFEIDDTDLTVYEGGNEVDVEDAGGIYLLLQDVEVDVDVTNVGTEEGSQQVTLWYYQGLNMVPTDSVETDELDTGEEDTVTLASDLENLDSNEGVLELVVTTENNEEQVDRIDILTGGEFDVEITDVNGQDYLPGETVEVTAEVENLGDIDDEQEVGLYVTDTETAETTETVELASEESTEVEFSWIPGDDDIGEWVVDVKSEDHIDSHDGIRIVEAPEFSDFQIDDYSSWDCDGVQMFGWCLNIWSDGWTHDVEYLIDYEIEGDSDVVNSVEVDIEHPEYPGKYSGSDSSSAMDGSLNVDLDETTYGTSADYQPMVISVGIDTTLSDTLIDTKAELDVAAADAADDGEDVHGILKFDIDSDNSDGTDCNWFGTSCDEIDVQFDASWETIDPSDNVESVDTITITDNDGNSQTVSGKEGWESFDFGTQSDNPAEFTVEVDATGPGGQDITMFVVGDGMEPQGPNTGMTAFEDDSGFFG